MLDRTAGDWQQVWRSGSGQIVTNVHSEQKCIGTPCTIHNPSDHHMREWPTFLRGGDPFDMGIFTERICPCGTGHPDPDDPMAPGTHGCCGEACCVKPA